MSQPCLFVGDLIFSSWSAKSLAYAYEIDFECDIVHFPLDYPIRLNGSSVERIPEAEIVQDFYTGCRCESSFFNHYIQAKLPVPASPVLHRVPILLQTSGQVFYDIISINSSMHESVTGTSLVSV